jgi:FAD/FMN-containing dehydrogenase/Fe-S oxidoreductase
LDNPALITFNHMPHNIREIPFNYTSFSDREIVIRFLGEDIWETLNRLRAKRRTGSSARLLFDILGDLWIIRRNPYIQDDLISHPKRLKRLIQKLRRKLGIIEQRANNNPDALNMIDATRTALQAFHDWLTEQQRNRKHLLALFRQHTDVRNIYFDPLSRVSHVTDASDWRVEYPLVILTPDTEAEVVALTRACLQQNLNIIARGGGTGYTGAAAPLTDNSVIINTEKLNQVGDVVMRPLEGQEEKVATVTVGAGAITRAVSDRAQEAGFVFAVDPTSQDASTIGGNIAMNAGGKKALMWGTTLDNLLSWRIVMADGVLYDITRLQHNLGKIHDVPTAAFQVRAVDSQDTGTIITLHAEETRKPGLGKDVTNKILGKLPGVQKEGCDGIITSATFVLHRQFAHTFTMCLEFYSPDMHQSVSMIQKLVTTVHANPDVALTGLEHLDARYIRAVGYSTKSTRSELPNMLLLADLAGNDPVAINTAITTISELCQPAQAEHFVATTNETRKEFWKDRSRTAAIAAHTNAFKINEDVVIPLGKLADYSTGIDAINQREAVANKREIITAFHDAISTRQQEYTPDSLQYPRLQRALDLLDTLSPEREGFSPQNDALQPLQQLFSGEYWRELRNQLQTSYQNIHRRKLFIATHMHAGDGNVHTNIPVFSNDYVMLSRADRLVDEVMVLTLECDGVISGEHGIGITKLKYLYPENIRDFEQYNREVDPQDNFNRGKLQQGAGLANAYTPSLRLLEMEALLLEESALGELNTMVKDCLRCGKCKPVCSTHAPRSRLLYSPRNKILATGLLIEAFLYEEQTRRGIALEHFSELNDIADHCTVCHRCVTPCPVNIDFGDVTAKIRSVLLEQRQKNFRPGQALSMAFLNTTSARMVNLMRHTMIRAGYAAQSTLGKLFPKSPPLPNTNKSTGITQQVVQFMRYPMPGAIPAKALRAELDIENPEYIPVINSPNNRDDRAVFYFPGCGSERLFSQIGLATLKWLHEQGEKVILPPGYMCCGYPQRAAGDDKSSNAIITQNRVSLHRLAVALQYLDVHSVIISCGTCLDQLKTYEFKRIFPNARLLDIHEYLLEQDVTCHGAAEYLLHDPCHSPDQVHNPHTVASTLLQSKITLSDRCCGESGAFAITRPDIAAQVKTRKLESLAENQQHSPARKILTTCPSCLQGLKRLEPDSGVTADYIILEMARQQFGDNWKEAFVQELKKPDAIERVLL